MEEPDNKLFIVLLTISTIIGVLVIVVVLILYFLFPWESVASAIPIYRTYLPMISYGSDVRHGIGLGYAGCGGLSKLTSMGWYYNWGYDPYCAGGVSYFDMVWRDDLFVTVHNNTVMGWNEPDHVAQSNLTPIEAASRWASVESLYPYAQLVSPATSSARIDWLWQMVSQYELAHGRPPRFDAIAIHYYPMWSGGYTLSGYVEEVRRQALQHGYNVPIWVTEFGICYVSQKQAIDFMLSSLNWMARQSYVARWAWFAGRVEPDWCWRDYDLIADDGTLTSLGEAYNSWGVLK